MEERCVLIVDDRIYDKDSDAHCLESLKPES